MSPIFIPLSPDRLEKALQLREQLYRHEDLVYDLGNAAVLLRELMADPNYGALWLIEVEREVAGYLLLTICYSLEFHGRFGLLDEFYLEERFRERGIGTAALAFAEHACRGLGLKALRLEVAHGNNRALELYRRQGFAVDPRHLMTKWL